MPRNLWSNTTDTFHSVLCGLGTYSYLFCDHSWPSGAKFTVTTGCWDIISPIPRNKDHFSYTSHQREKPTWWGESQCKREANMMGESQCKKPTWWGNHKDRGKPTWWGGNNKERSQHDGGNHNKVWEPCEPLPMFFILWTFVNVCQQLLPNSCKFIAESHANFPRRKCIRKIEITASHQWRSFSGVMGDILGVTYILGLEHGVFSSWNWKI